MKAKDLLPLENFAAAMLADCLADYNLSQRQLAAAIAVPYQRINDILNQRRLITPDQALRLGRYFGNGAEIWLRMQEAYQLDKARREAADDLQRIQPLPAA